MDPSKCRSTLLKLVFLTVAGWVSYAQAQVPDLGELKLMMQVQGRCRSLQIDGEALSCQGGVLYNQYANGRAAFVVNGTRAGADPILMSFSGKADRQADPKVFTLSIDRILATNAAIREIPAFGHCRMALPPEGAFVRHLKCEATDGTGKTYRLDLLPVVNTLTIHRF